jgi:hypothetical protein
MGWAWVEDRYKNNILARFAIPQQAGWWLRRISAYA